MNERSARKLRIFMMVVLSGMAGGIVFIFVNVGFSPSHLLVGKPVEENRFVLFVDIAGSTTLAERLGIHRFLDRTFCTLTGSVVDYRGEIGDIKRAIVFNGDVMNTAARLEELSRKVDGGFVASRAAIDRFRSAPPVPVRDLGLRDIRGKSDGIDVVGLAV